MKRLPAYTLIELLITITIVSLLVTMGVSAYSKARDRQVGQSGAEQLINILKENQQAASVGKKDCTGSYLGQIVTLTLANTVTSESSCEGGVGAPKSITINGVTFVSGATITFRPLSGGTNLSADPLNIDILSNNLTYRVQLTRAGTILYQGIQP